MAHALEPQGALYAASKLELALPKVIRVLELIFKEECTVPFIARYRKEQTGNMDEVEIRHIQEFYEEYIEIEKRREYILDSIKKMEKLTPELEKQIKVASTLNQLEDIYAPYKSKKKTKAMIAKELGLEPLANALLSTKDLPEIMKWFITELSATVDEKVKKFEDALAGATDIIVETMANDMDCKEAIRKYYWDHSLFHATKRDKAEEHKEFLKFKDFFDYKEAVKDLKDAKAGHRYLAMRRGMAQEILRVEVVLEGDYPQKTLEKKFFGHLAATKQYPLLVKCADKAISTYIHPSLDLEIKSELKKLADSSAIDVFGINLKNLLLQPYLGSKAVLGIDPGLRTGCKVVIVDATGKFVGDHVIYPHAPNEDIKGSAQILEKMIELFKIEYIAIGNGTAGRDTLEFVEKYVPQVRDGKVKATIISEAGASVYSASDVAREEFPDKDVTVRGAISIARRFQDPLAELVKIDPKSIGVGQYQHDINQAKLKNSLEGVVESCVNYVGVDLNTASAPLLSFVSGVGPGVAKNIVKFREEKGGFKNREQLLEVSRFTKKTFEQAAGFLRIYAGVNPLDATFIHPERYDILINWAKAKGKTLQDLIADRDLQGQLEKDKALLQEVGELTLADIVKSLKAPSQDPRTIFKSVEFTQGLKDIKDLKIGQWYTGVINNITNFGAFVDIGLKESGLLHISQMADKFIENPLEHFKVGQEIKARVTEIDFERKRISLSCKTGDQPVAKSPSEQAAMGSKRPMKGAPTQQPEIKNNAFAKFFKGGP